MDLNEIRSLAGLQLVEAKEPTTGKGAKAFCKSLKLAPKLSSMIVLAMLQDASPDAMAGRGDLMVKALIKQVVESIFYDETEENDLELIQNTIAWAKAMAAGRFEQAAELFGDIGPFTLYISSGSLTSIVESS
jgi:hypothetical protein